jgi:hypothetical protein
MRPATRDFTSICMKIKEFSKPHKGFSPRRTKSASRAETRRERSSSEK